MFDLRDPWVQALCAKDPQGPYRNQRALGVEEICIINVIADFGSKHGHDGPPGVPRHQIPDKARCRTPFSSSYVRGQIPAVLDAMLAVGMLESFTDPQSGSGRPASYVRFPGASLAPPVAGTVGICPYADLEPYATFRLPHVHNQIHAVEVLCVARGRQLGRSFKCHTHRDGTVEVWRES